MTFKQKVRAGSVCLALLGFSACSDPVATNPSRLPSDSPSGPPTTPVPPVTSSPRVIQPGQTVAGTIRSQDAECFYYSMDGGWGGLCNAFSLTAPTAGTLEITVRSEADAVFVLMAKTAGGGQIDLACCVPGVLQIPVDSATTYRIELAYGGRPVGYPHIPDASYTLETKLLPPEAQKSRDLNAVVFGDVDRTQRLSQARLEILEGAAAGAVAIFDDAAGTYALTSLPPGFVQVHVSAPGFTPQTFRLPVGANLARELVLRRLVELPAPTFSLYGVAWANADHTGAYSGVKVEIVDGPLAGVFTFTDEFFGVYMFRGVPPGLVHVRVTAQWQAPQTLSVVVSGDTRLDFQMP